MGTSDQRRRKLFPFFVLTQMLYGYHGSIVWTGEWRCVVDAPSFAKTLRTTTAALRRAVEFLSRHRYVKHYTWGKGFIQLELKPPHIRRAEDAS